MAVDKGAIARAVGQDRYERGRRIAWATAAKAGKALSWSEIERAQDGELYDIIDDVLMAAFGDGDSAADKMRKVCELFPDVPSYTILSQLFMNIGQGTLPEAERTFFFRFLGVMLSAKGDELAEPAAYLLWVDYFEVDEYVDAAWLALCAAITSDIGWRRLLEASGPVPERLKVPLMERFIDDPSHHEAIFEALAAAVFDVYGKMERTTVESFLPRLHVDRAQPRYTALLERLADPAPIEFGWRFKQK